MKRLALEVGIPTRTVGGLRGTSHILQSLGKYNEAVHRLPWLVLVDLDRDADCAPAYRRAILPHAARFMCFRVAVRTLDAWILADRDSLAAFLKVDSSRIPLNPEAEADPKRQIVTIERRSKDRRIRDDMVPDPASGRVEGPAYDSRLIEYVGTMWRPDVAAQHSDRLRRCRERLRTEVAGWLAIDAIE